AYMAHRLTKIYTRTGDQGTTCLSDGSRTEKDHPRVDAIGDIDELNCVLGLLLSHALPKDIHHSVSEIQQTLFDIGGELSMPAATTLTEGPVAQLEQQLEMYNATLTPLREFILPGSTEASARCHLARAVCRRVERHVVTIARSEPVNHHVLSYLNRLSDLLFVLSRVLTRLGNGREIYWRSAKMRSEET